MYGLTDGGLLCKSFKEENGSNIQIDLKDIKKSRLVKDVNK
ncbi:hypothetical protein BSM4216_2184 [Bacillus smithii]|nr:hypothetical protein BSM4216_2184 [Bacillus smithii]